MKTTHGGRAIKAGEQMPMIPAVNPIESAKSAGLRYVCDNARGIRREMGPLGFRYRGVDGKIIRKASELKRIRALAVPPAWTDVWICADPRGHLQATGRDAKGRKQYRYHPEWRTCRDETKFERMQEFAAALPGVRRRTAADLSRHGLPREKVLATVVQLLEKSLIRVGNDEYARDNNSYGLTTLRKQHADVQGAKLTFQFRGKSGVRHSVGVNDRRLARIVAQCRDLPGQELFQYVDEEGTTRDVTSQDVNEYLKEISGEDFTAKDFRTWAGTVLAYTALRELDRCTSVAHGKRNCLQAIEAVAGMLGNTRAVCRKSYIHPVILDAYVDGSLFDVPIRRQRGLVRVRARQTESGLRPEEVATLAILRQRAQRQPARTKAA